MTLKQQRRHERVIRYNRAKREEKARQSELTIPKRSRVQTFQDMKTIDGKIVIEQRNILKDQAIKERGDRSMGWNGTITGFRRKHTPKHLDVINTKIIKGKVPEWAKTIPTEKPIDTAELEWIRSRMEVPEGMGMPVGFKANKRY